MALTLAGPRCPFAPRSYSCVPQAHRATQELAISSISVYSSRAHAFVAVCPEIRHTDTGEMCDAETYQGRLWVRAEILSHLLINGRDTMWVATGAKPSLCVRMPPEWVRGSTVRVFDGEVRRCNSYCSRAANAMLASKSRTAADFAPAPEC